jgi:peptidyl-Lys metalloendopeptidase
MLHGDLRELDRLERKYDEYRRRVTGAGIRVNGSYKIRRYISGRYSMRKSLLFVLCLLLSAGSARAADLRAELELSSGRLGEGENLVASVTLVNLSSRTVLVPRWLVPGERLEADLFEVARGGEPVDYLGRLVKRAAPGAADFVALAPGESLRGTTELTKHYDMGDGGEYAVVYRVDLLDGIDAGALGAVSEKVESNAVAVWREGPTSNPRPAWVAPMSGDGALSTVNCTASESTAIGTAVTNATSYSSNSESYFDSRTWSSVGARYTTWFGAPDSGRFDTVADNYAAIRSAFQTAPVVVNCDCDEDYYAYVYANQPYEIFVCNAFWAAPATGTDSKAGTLVHEMSHFDVVAGTRDRAYGQSACMNLANSQPQFAVMNADSHEYFAENTPARN